MSHDPVRGEYDQLAADYDRRWCHYARASADLILAPLHPQPGEQILDVGCGTGVLLEQLAQREPTLQLVGIDLSPAMLRVAKTRLAASIPLVAARAERLPWAADTFDAVVSSSMLHFVPDPIAALNEMARVVRSGGRLVLTDWSHDAWAMRLAIALMRWRDPNLSRGFRSKELIQAMTQAGWIVEGLSSKRLSGYWTLLTARARVTKSFSRWDDRA